MICAPVIIPTLCRYEHFKRCIESLSHCTNAEHTEVYVGLDYPAKETHWDGYNKIRDYLAHCGDLGFKKIIVIKRDRNYGIGENGNYDTLRRFILTKYDTYISTEDDNIFAPCFLDFMNKSLIFYKNDPKISSVSGYLQYHIKYSSEGNGVYLTPFVTAWGMGHWKHKEMDLCQRNEFAIQLFKSIKWRFQIWKFSPNLCGEMCHTLYTICINNNTKYARSVIWLEITVLIIVDKIAQILNIMIMLPSRLAQCSHILPYNQNGICHGMCFSFII